jgi:hypothetical protein
MFVIFCVLYATMLWNKMCYLLSSEVLSSVLLTLAIFRSLINSVKLLKKIMELLCCLLNHVKFMKLSSNNKMSCNITIFYGCFQRYSVR